MVYSLNYELLMYYCFIWCSYGIAAISPFSHRLSFDNLPVDIQHLRCKVNFQALTFVSHIRTLGDALISRLRYPQGSAEEMGFNYLQEVTGAGARKNAGKFVVLHLRFDKVLLFLHLFDNHLCVQVCNVRIFVLSFYL